MKFSNYFLLLSVIINLFIIQSHVFGVNTQEEAQDVHVWLNTGNIKPNFSTFNNNKPLSIDLYKYEEGKDLSLKFLDSGTKAFEITLENLRKKNLIKPNVISIVINIGGSLRDFPGEKISFPFSLKVTYEGKTFKSEKFGNLDKESVNGKLKRTPTILEDAHPYYDALILGKIKNKEVKKVKAVLEKYLSEEDEPPTTETDPNTIIKDLMKKFEDNPYITEYLVRIKDQRHAAGIQSTASIERTKIEWEKVGGISVTKLADGMAKFLVERAKEELSVAFFKKFKSEFSKEKFGYVILQTIFPETWCMLQLIEEEIYNYSSYLQIIRDAFEKDLSNIYQNLPKVIGVGKINEFFSDKCWLKVILISGFNIIDGLNREKHPGDILADLDTKIMKDDKFKNLVNAIELLKILSNSLRAKADGNNSYWINVDSVKELFKEDHDNPNSFSTFELYLGLIYQQTGSIEFLIKNQKKAFAGDLLAALKDNMNKMKGFMAKIDGFVSKTDLVEKSLKELKEIKSNHQKPVFEDYYKVFEATMGTFEYSLGFFEFTLDILNPYKKEDNKNIIANSIIKKHLSNAKTLGNIYLEIKRRNYSQVIYNLIKVGDSILLLHNNHTIESFSRKHNEAKTNKGKAVDEIAKNEATQNDKQIRKKNKQLEKYKKFRAKFLKYGAFMAAVARAENSDEVKKAIESAALPAGSYRIKRTRAFTISLNSYVGFFCNRERYNQMQEPEKPNKNLAVTAPLGLALNKGIKSKEHFVSSLSLFCSIIDLGAMVRYHFTDTEGDGEKGLSEVTFKDIFAPGLFLIYGFKNSPISIGGGVQYGPKLTKVLENGEIVTIEKSRFRFGIMVTIDIPLVHFK